MEGSAMRYSVFIKLLPSLVQVVGLPVGALLAYHLGLRTYRKQKSMEECRRRYLTEGLDALTKDFGRSLAAAHRNWATAVWLAETLRQVAVNRKLASLLSFPAEVEGFASPTTGLDQLDQVEEPLGTEALRHWFFQADADMTNMRLSMTFRILPLFRAYLGNPGAFSQDPSCTANHLSEEADKHLHSAKRHEPLLQHLLKLSRELWKAGISFESIHEVQSRPEVLSIREAIEAGWAKIEKVEPKE
jgi:hypothetical protein